MLNGCGDNQKGSYIRMHSQRGRWEREKGEPKVINLWGERVMIPISIHEVMAKT